MSVSRDDVLIDAIKEALSLYQKSLVWAMTAALSGFLIGPRLQNPQGGEIEILHGTLSAPGAWSIAQALYVIFGALACSAINRYKHALALLAPEQDVLKAIRLFPSLATQSPVLRFGSLGLPVLVTFITWGIEISKEHPGWNPAPSLDWWFGAAIIAAIFVAPYAGIAVILRDVERLSPSHVKNEDATPAGAS